MNTKTLIATSVLVAGAVAGGLMMREGMGSGKGNSLQGNVIAELGPENDSSGNADPVVTPIQHAAGESVFLKRPVLDMSRAVSKGTLTSAEKIKRDRERAARAREDLEAGFAGNWRGLSPFAVNESIIAHAEISISGNDATGFVWVVTEFREDGAQCTIAPLDDARQVGDELSFRAQGQIGTLKLGERGDVARGTWAGRKAELVRLPGN